MQETTCRESCARTQNRNGSTNLNRFDQGLATCPIPRRGEREATRHLQLIDYPKNIKRSVGSFLGFPDRSAAEANREAERPDLGERRVRKPTIEGFSSLSGWRLWSMGLHRKKRRRNPKI